MHRCAYSLFRFPPGPRGENARHRGTCVRALPTLQVNRRIPRKTEGLAGHTRLLPGVPEQGGDAAQPGGMQRERHRLCAERPHAAPRPLWSSVFPPVQRAQGR